jgi:hypothetical protein
LINCRSENFITLDPRANVLKRLFFVIVERLKKLALGNPSSLVIFLKASPGVCLKENLKGAPDCERFPLT